MSDRRWQILHIFGQTWIPTEKPWPSWSTERLVPQTKMRVIAGGNPPVILLKDFSRCCPHLCE